MTTVRSGREQHAVHHRDGGGNDLEWWVYAQPEQHPVPEEIPKDAVFHTGAWGNGQQLWRYTRLAPLTGPACYLCTQEQPKPIPKAGKGQMLKGRPQR